MATITKTLVVWIVLTETPAAVGATTTNTTRPAMTGQPFTMNTDELVPLYQGQASEHGRPNDKLINSKIKGYIEVDILMRVRTWAKL